MPTACHRRTTSKPSFPPARPTRVIRIAGAIIRYHLLQGLGNGGKGEVSLAEQKEPVRRRVVIKPIKSGMDTREVLARFESERQALALNEPPGHREGIRRWLNTGGPAL